MPDDAPGADAVAAAFRATYGDAHRERRVPELVPPADDAVLHAIDAYRGEQHWHLVTLGLTALASPGTDPEVSGWGHELTVLTPPSERAPGWAFELLLGVARTVVAAQRPLHAGARLAPGAPLDGAGSGLVAVGLREDPLVTATRFPFGHYAFLQVVGVTTGEYAVMRRVGTGVVLAKLAERDALLRTDPARA